MLGEPKPLFRVNTPGGAVQMAGSRQPYVATPDGSRFLVSTADAVDTRTVLSLIMNWTPASATP